jgi:glycine oxidase
MMAWHLLESGKTVVVVDNGLPSASTIAAGLFNPVTGRRFVKSWLIDDLLPYAETTYHKLEDVLGEKFYFPKPVVHFISGQEEKNVYERSLTDDNRKYITGFTSSDSDDRFASCEIKGGGFVDTGLLIASFRKYLEKKNIFIEEAFDYKNLVVNTEYIHWKDISATQIIFCEGYKAVNNPYFPGMPFNLAKGEILTLSIPGLHAEKILMSGVYLVPLGNDIYKLGATYEWDNLEPGPTNKGKEELLHKLKNLTTFPFEILNHEAGIRPTMKQRRPFVGRHPNHNNIFILNGLGTKGVLLAPYFANELCRLLLHGIPTSGEVGLGRFDT